MRRIVVLASLMMFISISDAQSPPDLLSPPPPPLQTPPTIQSITLTPNNPPLVVQQTAGNSGIVKPGDQVRVLRGTYIYSGPSEQSYRCGKFEGGESVVILDLPSPGAEFTAIASPDNCYSLIPLSTVHHSMALWVNVKDLMKQPQTTLKAVETLMDGESPQGEYLSSGYILPKGIRVKILDERKVRHLGKEEVYCVISSAGKEKRFVRTADLEGVAAAQAANSPLQNTNPQYGDNRAQQQHWQDHSSVQQTAMEGDQLPPQLSSQVQAAEQAYRTALHYGAWEDARLAISI